MKLSFLIFVLNIACAFGQATAPPPDVEFPDFKVPKPHICTIGAPEPEYPGGIKALKEHVQIYDHPGWEGEEKSKRGYVSFIVEADGSLMDIEVIRGISPELDDLMLRIIEEMPKWIPACDRNDCYRSRVRLPITFVS